MEVGHISQVVENKGFYAFIPFAQTHKLEHQNITDVYVEIPDPRRHSPQQHRKVFGLINEITRWSCGYADKLECEDMRAVLTFNFCMESNIEIFSMSNADMTTVKSFIDYLVNFCVVHDVPCLDTSLLEFCEDISKYIYACLANRKCALCGKKADIHHIGADVIGMGGNRQEKPQLGARCLPLCRLHHCECHNTGDTSFCNKYHVYGIKLDVYLCELLKIRK